MKIKHSFVVLLDLPEILPFSISEEEGPKMEELGDFVDNLSEKLVENIYYIGQDTIGEKFYERFLFEKGGFLEIMVQAPVAIVAHFVEQKRAERFAEALREVILGIKDKVAPMLAKNIEVQTEKEQPLDYKTWSKLRRIREAVQ
jgi:hypothetical protein